MGRFANARTWGLLVFVWALAGLPLHARAERLLTLPAGGSASLHGEATRELESLEGALRAAGHEVVRAAPREVELSELLLACDGARCASSGLEALGADALVAVSLWMVGDGRRQLTVTVLGGSGVPTELAFDRIDPRDPSATTLAAHVDDAVRSPGSTAVPSPIPVPLTTHATPGRRRASRANYGLGLGLALVGLGPLALAGRTLARDGTCADALADGLCRVEESGRFSVVSFGTRSLVWLIGGSAMVTTGVFFIAARPLRLRVEAAPGAVGLRVSGTF